MNATRCLAFLFLFSCSTAKQEPVESTSGKPTNSTPENLTSSSDAYLPIMRKEDSTMFIGFIGHHENTNEYYVPIYYLADSIDETFFEEMSLALDSTVVNDDETTRKRLNTGVAVKNFNLFGLDTITLFSKAGKHLGKATLSRVEYLDFMIEGEYTAVFKPVANVNANETVYCTSKGSTSFKENRWDWRVLTDPSLDNQLLRTFDLDSQMVLNISHVHFDDLNATYSSVSMQGNRVSLLVETKNRKSTAVMMVPKDYSLSHLQPVHFSFHDHPVFISAIMPNDTDGSFDVLLAFNGEKYEMLPRSRSK